MEKLREHKFLLITSVFISSGYIGYQLFEHLSTTFFGTSFYFLKLDLNSVIEFWNSNFILSYCYYFILEILIAVLFSIAILVIVWILFNVFSVYVLEKEVEVSPIFVAESIVFDSIVICIKRAIAGVILLIVYYVPAALLISVFGKLPNIWLMLIIGGIILLSKKIYDLISAKSKINNTVEKAIEKTASWHSFVVSLSVNIVFFVLMRIYCFELTLSTKDNIYSQSDSTLVEVEFKLGGSASDTNKLSLTITGGDNKRINFDKIYHKNESTFIAVVNTSKLFLGTNTISLNYRHFYFSASPPFLRDSISRTYSIFIEK